MSDEATKKVVINACFGGFGLSREGQAAYLARRGKQAFFYTHRRDNGDRLDFGKLQRAGNEATDFITFTFTEDLGETFESDGDFPDSYFRDGEIRRDDPDLVAVVEQLGRRADDRHASLEVVEIPADVDFVIEEYDGAEHVAEAHRVWS